MEVGIFAKTFTRPTLEGVLDAVISHGIHCIQFNFAVAGVPSLPPEIHPELVDHIGASMAVRGITAVAVSGTFNMIDPDLERRREGLRRLGVLIASCERLGTSVITLCTGTRDPEDMWTRHPLNDSEEAWQDLVESIYQSVDMVARSNVTLAFEPEVSNVIDTAQKGRSLLDEIRSPHLKVVMDPANLFREGELRRMRSIMDEAFEFLGEDIVIAHAKDLSADGEAGHEAAGQGVLDYDHYLSLLRTSGYDGPLILHSLTESQVDDCLVFLAGKLATPASGKLT
jgi:sugar phosphate isomerase/epimerase